MSTALNSLDVFEDGVKAGNALREEIILLENKIDEVQANLDAIVPGAEEYLQSRCRNLLDKIAHDRMQLSLDDPEHSTFLGMYRGVRNLLAWEANLNTELAALLEQKAELQSDYIEMQNRLKENN
jgi:cell division protein FtsB